MECEERIALPRGWVREPIIRYTEVDDEYDRIKWAGEIEHVPGGIQVAEIYWELGEEGCGSRDAEGALKLHYRGANGTALAELARLLGCPVR